MKLTILCSSPSHPINKWLDKWAAKKSRDHDINFVREKKSATGGDILFLISCSNLISVDVRRRYKKTLVLHASDLPAGRGWSPHIWQLLDGAEHVTMTLLEAEDKVDAGAIWKRKKIKIDRGWLYDDINKAIFDSELELMDFAIENCESIKPIQQDPNAQATYYPKRTPNDSRIDQNRSIAEQFDIMRVSDPERFPAFFEMYGNRYLLKIEKG